MGGRTYLYRDLLLPSADWNASQPVDAWEPSTRPGLAIHRGIGADDGRWIVSHASSGLALGYGGCPSFAAAEAFMVDLLGSGVDWTMTASEIRDRKDEVRPVVRAACERHGVGVVPMIVSCWACTRPATSYCAADDDGCGCPTCDRCDCACHAPEAPTSDSVPTGATT